MFHFSTRVLLLWFRHFEIYLNRIIIIMNSNQKLLLLYDANGHMGHDDMRLILSNRGKW